MRVWMDLGTPGQCSRCSGQLEGHSHNYGVFQESEYVWYAHRCKKCGNENVYLKHLHTGQRESRAPGLKCVLKAAAVKENQLLLL